MSAIIKNMVLTKRVREAEQQDRTRFLAQAKGDPGPQGDTGPAPKHEWQGTKLRFQKPDGKWGKLTDLKGDAGKDGTAGRTVVVARGGSSGTDLASLTPGNTNAEPTGLVVFQGGKAVNLPWPAFIQTIAGAVDVGTEMARRTDFVGEILMYRGEAAPGTAETAAAWRIKRVMFSPDGDITETFASGNADFINAWSDRATLEYI